MGRLAEDRAEAAAATVGERRAANRRVGARNTAIEAIWRAISLPNSCRHARLPSNWGTWRTAHRPANRLTVLRDARCERCGVARNVRRTGRNQSCPPSSKSLISTMNRRSRVGPTICRHCHLRPGPPASIPELHRSVPSFRTGLTSSWTLWQTSPRTLTSFRCSRSELAFRAEPPQSEPSSGLLPSRCRSRRGTRWVPASHDGRPSTSETDCDAEESAHAANQLRPGGPHQDSIDPVI